VEKRTGLAVSKLGALDRDRVSANSSRGSLSTASAYVDRLEFAATSTTTTSTTTSTTAPKPTPTTVKKKTTPPTTKRPTPTTKPKP
jgi:hypothetical protein